MSKKPNILDLRSPIDANEVYMVEEKIGWKHYAIAIFCIAVVILFMVAFR